MAQVLLCSNDRETVHDVALALESNGQLADEDVLGDLSALAGRLEHAAAPGVLIDISTVPVSRLAELEPIIARFTESRFILLCDDPPAELLLEAMHIGARHVLPKPAIVRDLPAVIERLIPNGTDADTRRGSVVSLMSASGGCGTTTLAINLAYELHLLRSSPSLLVDLDWIYGASAAYLGLDTPYGVADVIADQQRIDPQLIRSSSVPYGDALYVLASPAAGRSPATPTPSPALVQTALEACCDVASFTVVDAPRADHELATTLARTSQLTLLVFQLTVKDLHSVRSLWSRLVEDGVLPSRLILVANRYCRRRAMITLSEVRQVLGEASVRTIRNDYRSAIRGLNFGQPLAQAARRSVLRKDLRELAVSISEANGASSTRKEKP